jgi:hypothetical protein
MRGEEMNIETDFTSSTLELSHPVGDMKWEEAMSTEWPDGWKVPVRGDLIKVYDEAMNSRRRFPDRSNVWSSSSCAKDTTFAWNVNFYNGHSYAGNKTNVYSIRLVREVRK